MLKSFPQFTINTEDWGYFQRAYEEVKSGENMRWEEYNVALYIMLVSAISGGLLIIGTVLSLIKFCCSKWGLWTIVI